MFQIHFSFFLIFLNPFYAYFLNKLYQNCNLSYKKKNLLTLLVIKKIKFFFGIVTIENSAIRRETMYNFWIRNISAFGHEYVYCTKTPIEPYLNWIPVKNWGNPNMKFNSNLDRINKRLTMAEYFLKNTSADFFINPTDDVIVDAIRINQLAYILGEKYDTFTDLIMLGNCQTTHINFSYFQGGTGYIMTRKMAQLFIHFGHKWFIESNGPDDFEISRFLKYINKKPSDGAIPYMVGHSFHDFLSPYFSPNNLPKCQNFYEEFCKQGIHNLEDVYIFHPYHTSLFQSFKMWNIFQEMIHDQVHHYGYYNVFPETRLCQF